MALPVVDGATLKCTMGTSTCSLTVLPTNRVQMEGAYAANIMDYIPMANISGFGNCITLSNPTVAAATSAALGVLTPQPCIPVIAAPWAPGSAAYRSPGAVRRESRVSPVTTTSVRAGASVPAPTSAPASWVTSIPAEASHCVNSSSDLAGGRSGRV